MRSSASSLGWTVARPCPGDDTHFAKEVLQLDGRSEDDLDAELRHQAIELGIEFRPQPATPPVSEPSSSRYSTSIDSRISISTARSEASVYSYDTRQSTTSSYSARSTRSHKSTLARIKGLGLLLRAGRNDLKSCPHCPKDVASQRRALHELPCGHRLCTQALRTAVTRSIGIGTEPTCCAMQIPDRLVRHVLTGDEVMKYQDRQKIAASGAGPLASSDSCTSSSPVSPRHLAESARFTAWAEGLKSAMQGQRDEMLKLLEVQHLRSLDAQLEARTNDMATAEDRQVKAEADLRHLQQQEIRDNATALKHMEAYCAGTTASGAPHDRSITEQDLAELRKTQAIRDGMQQRHTSAINILRGEQNRRMKLRSQRHDQDRRTLEAAYRREVSTVEHHHRLEEASLADDCLKRQHRLETRWQLQDLIEARKVARLAVSQRQVTGLSATTTSFTAAINAREAGPIPKETLSEFLASTAAS